MPESKLRKQNEIVHIFCFKAHVFEGMRTFFDTPRYVATN